MRPITLCTGQWADLPLEELARKCKQFGFDGLELACWGDHFEVQKALQFVRKLDFEPSRVAFDAAFDKAEQTKK